MVNKDLAEKLVQIASQCLKTSIVYKQPRLEKIKMAEDLYFGKIKQKLRTQFNIPLPVMDGFVDTLEADLDDPIELRFKHTDPADALAFKKINAAWRKESKSSKPNAKWQLKMRWDKKLAIMSGRGIQKTFAESDPHYKNYLEIVSYKHFHCQPGGGGILENHTFRGMTGLKRTKEDLIDRAKNGLYYKDSVEELISYIDKDKFAEGYARDMDEDDPFSRFKGLDLDPESNNYTGQVLFYPAEFEIKFNNKYYYVLFDPYTLLPLRVEKLTEVVPSGRSGFTSWATHEDPDIFWSKAYSDQFFPVAMGIIDLFNQDMTNRSKQNLHARAFDIDMFPDVSKLDEAQWRPDALVPVDTKGGARKIAEGLYEFKTPELKGTFDAIDWLERKVGKETGVTDLDQASGPARGKVNIQFANLQEAQKRIGHKSHAYTECWGEIGERYVEGLVEHITEPILVELVGQDGVGWEELSKQDLDFKKGFEVEVISITERDKQNVLGKDQKIAALKELGQDQNVNPKWRAEQILRDIGGYDEEAIQEALDVQNYGQRDILAEADFAIRELLRGKMPDLVYDANISFANKILRYEKAHYVALSKKKAKDGRPISILFFEYVQQHKTIIIENSARAASQIKAQKASGTDSAGSKPMPSKQPVPQQAMHRPQVQVNQPNQIQQ